MLLVTLGLSAVPSPLRSADGLDAAKRLETSGDAAALRAAPLYADALQASGDVLSLATRWGDEAARERSSRVRGGLIALLLKPGLLSPAEGSRAGGKALPPPAAGAVIALPILVEKDGEPTAAALEKLGKFLQAAGKKMAGVPAGEGRDPLFVLEALVLARRALGDMEQKRADAAYSQALAALAASAPPSDPAESARLAVARARLLYKLRDFGGARSVLEAPGVDASALPAAERCSYFELARDLARFAGDRSKYLAALARLGELGATAEEAASLGAPFFRPLGGTTVDLAETCQTLLAMVARYRLSPRETGLLAYLGALAAGELGEAALAEEILRRHVPEATGDPWLDASVAARLGQFQGEIGELEAALDSLERAGGCVERLGGAAAFRSRIEINAARGLLSLGQVDRAREKLGSVLGATDIPRDLEVRARILLGNVMYEKARESPSCLPEARVAFETARSSIAAGQAAGKPLDGAVELDIAATVNLANVLRREAQSLTGDAARARRTQATDLQDRAMRAAHAAGCYPLAAVASANLGELYLEAGDLAAAKGFVAWALDRATERQLLETQWRCHWYRARIAEKEGEESLADAEYAVAESLVESYRSRILGAERKAGFLTDKVALYQDLVRRALSKGRADLALAAAERSKARALVDSLGLRFVALADPRQAELYREYVGLVARAEKAREGGTAGLLGVKALPVDYAQLRARLDGLKDRVRKSVREDDVVRALVDGGPLDAPAILAKIPPGATLVEYVPLESSLVALVAVGGRVEAVRLEVSSGDLSEEVARFILGGAADAEAARRLYGWLVAPIERLLRGARVIVVPHGCIHQLPLESLRDAKGYLVSRLEFVYLPSASMLRYVRQGGGPVDGGARLLAVVDPDTDYDGDGKPEMPPLPFAREEVAGFADRFQQREILVGPQALKMICRDRSPHFDVIHYACHGEFRPSRPWDSALFLASDGAKSHVRDGRLRASEVYGFDLRRSRLVALSGCETGRGQVMPGDDTVSIATSFLHAGASSLLVSLWKVEDHATSALMRGFYTKWLGEGKDKASALRESKLELIASGFGQPKQWAAFVLVGAP